MPNFFFEISDGREKEISISAASPQAAVNDALNALTQFACRNFPPPENISIAILNADRSPVATLRLAFEIEYATASQGLKM